MYLLLFDNCWMFWGTVRYWKVWQHMVMIFLSAHLFQWSINYYIRKLINECQSWINELYQPTPLTLGDLHQCLSVLGSFHPLLSDLLIWITTISDKTLTFLKNVLPMEFSLNTTIPILFNCHRRIRCLHFIICHDVFLRSKVFLFVGSYNLSYSVIYNSKNDRKEVSFCLKFWISSGHLSK